ncbi:2-hydroxymuconic semialdehyde dehydrogenase [Novosphingobium humi]|uniref:2-hydroxymuconic semialdehyde dehydrogenase n=1 Tax=Novosphingobium humi TaxID=2282397 RepID=A0ABY7U0T7_9SPHN|nr:2-hydroxymuconic semialdehyde dehydrogenase [Novosphingobium humi]WCT79143.1 2-hydroxymuconic semialdehyde dehydrogenase [Novosphingobium humi]
MSKTQYRNFVGGQFVATDRCFDDINPSTGQAYAQVHEASAELVDQAADAAHKALKGEWGNSRPEQRAALLDRIADGIDRRFDEFLAAEVNDTGKPAALASSLDVPRGAANFRAFASMIRTAGGEVFETPTPDGSIALNYTMRRPLGTVGIISPWNLPLLLFSWKVAPALACGNVVIAKPSEETPGTATLLAEVIAEAGAPDGVFNLVHGFGPGSAGEAIVKSSKVNGITFTGESGTGATIMRQAAEGVRPVSFELGGKNAALVFADCDFEETVAGVARSTFLNTGQVCLCTERVYVQRPIYEKFVAALAEAARKLRIGDPWAQGTDMGPLISKGHRQKVLDYMALAKQEGAEVVTGGGIPAVAEELGGWFIEPTVWTGLAQNSRCMQEEVFGPVCNVFPFDTEEEAVALANDSKYGLACAIWTSNLKRGHRLAAQIEVGLVWLNTWFLRDLRTPFGGAKLSGLGREGGHHSLDFYSELKNVCVKL